MYKNLAFCTMTNDVLLFCKFSLIVLPTSLSLKMPYTNHFFVPKLQQAQGVENEEQTKPLSSSLEALTIALRVADVGLKK